MVPTTPARWSDLANSWVANEKRFSRARWAILAIAGIAGAFAPLAAVLVLGSILVAALLWRHPSVLPLALIAVMGNTKFNFYLGFVTVFPEYVILAVWGLILVLRWLEQPAPLEEGGFLWLFAALTFAGVLSCIMAIEMRPALARAFIIPVAGAAFWSTLTGIRTRAHVSRALIALQWSVAIGAAFGVAQMIAIAVFKRNLDLGFLRRFGNPEFEYSIGAPVIHQLTSTFRANGLFNDPNIFGGFLAAMIPILAALALGPWASASRARFVSVWSTLALGVIALILSLSRSGVLAAVVGMGVLLLLRPSWLRSPRLWTGLGALVVAGVSVAAVAGVKVFLIVARLMGSFSSHDVSARTHESAFVFALELFARFPITGVGLRNFGAHYGRELEPGATSMMAHNAFVGWLAESGVVGGVAMAALLIVIVTQVRRAWRSSALESRDPEMHALLAGMLAAFAAMAVSNVFYDFWLRSFVWVVFGFAVALARLVRASERPE